MQVQSNRHAFRLTLTAIALATATLLSACGGSDNDDGDDGTPQAETVDVSGVLVKPLSNAASATRVIAKQLGSARDKARAASTACPNVPDGYDPLASVAVEFRDDKDAVLATLTTDACGGFNGAVPESVTTVVAAAANATTISQPVSTFLGDTATVASALPSSADLVVSVLQDLGGGKVALTVTDSDTGKAVLGLNTSNFNFSAGSQAITPSSLSYGASTAQSASVAIVMDASGSMSSTVGSTGKTAIQLASAAFHELLDGLSSGQAEAGAVIFGSSSTVINDAALAALQWTDANGVAVSPYQLGSSSGLVSDIKKLRPVADLYNDESKLYPGGTDDVHPDTGNLHLATQAYGGSTAFFDGTSDGLGMLSAASNTRRIVVAMTDGEDNSSSETSVSVIAKAKAEGVPLYLVAFGDEFSVDEPTMQDMAQQTGGEYKRVEGDDLAGLFQSIQTGIRFQYVSSFPAAFASGTTLSTTVTAGGKTATRTLTIR